jgi:glycine cleavage system transcriptional repressor
MPRFMVTAIGADRPGVVAAISGVLVELGCNLSDTQMAVLQGYASMMLVVDGPKSLEADALQSELIRGTEGLRQTIWVNPLSEASLPARAGYRWVVLVHGADRPGVVFEVTRVLAEHDVNIVDLQGRLPGPVGSVSMQVDVPPGVDGEELARELDRLGEQLGLSCSMKQELDRP